jgi:predicted DNA-binding protein
MNEETRSMENPGVLFKLPIDLRNQFKAVCAIQGRTMSSVLEEAVRQYVKQAENGSKAF